MDKPKVNGEIRKSLDQVWNENLDKIEGNLGIKILPNDRPDVISRIIKALSKTEELPEDLDFPRTFEEVEAVNEFANKLYELFCEGATYAEDMMIGSKVMHKFENICEEEGRCRDWYKETGHTRRDF